MRDKEDWQVLAFETLAPTDAAAKSISEPIRTVGFTEARGALIGPIETIAVRYRKDGVDPTTAVGHYLNIGDVAVVYGKKSVKNIKIIATSGTASVPITTYF